MPNWSSDVPANTKANGYDLRRTPADRPIKAIITAEDLIGCYTHFWRNRTQPCEGPGCQACQDNMPTRWHGYVSCLDPSTFEHFLFEFTQKAAGSFTEYRETYGTLRGCFFHSSRPKRQKNSRISILCKPADQTRITLPPPPNIQLALSVIWQLPKDALPTPDAMDGHPTVKTNNAVLDRMRDTTPGRNGHKTKTQEPVT